MHSRWLRIGLVGFGATALVFLGGACGGDGDDEPDATRIPTSDVLGGDPQAGSCSVTLSGDENITIQGNGGSAAAGSDYWMSDQELRDALETLLKAGGTAEDELEDELEAAMASDEPKLYLLILNCIDREDRANTLLLLPSNGSTYRDVPFEPGTYEIPAAGAAQGPGTFTAQLAANDASYKVKNAGVLELTKFDDTGVAGEFSFVAEEQSADGDAKEVSVTGRFDFECTGGAACGD